MNIRRKDKYSEDAMKKFLFVLLFMFLFGTPAFADVVWPSLYIVGGMLSVWVIIAGFLIELLFVKFFTDTKWPKAGLVTFVMNLITSLLGIILIPISGLGVEVIFDFVFHAYDKFGIGTFHWSHWLVSYLLVILINTLIEGLVIKLMLKQKFKSIFWWLFGANTLSVLICVLFLALKG